MYKRTNLKVEVQDGMQTIVRTVYELPDGRQFFKHNGEQCIIFCDEKGNYRAPWFPSVRYITE